MWLSKGQILVWLKHKTSNVTGGTINIAANVVNCNWPVIRAYLSDHMPIILTELEPLRGTYQGPVGHGIA